MSTCTITRTQISDVLDERRAALPAEAERHIEECPTCREFRAESRELDASLSRRFEIGSDTPLPEGLHDRIMAEVGEVDAVAQDVDSKVVPFAGGRVLVWLGVAAAVVLVTFLAMRGGEKDAVEGGDIADAPVPAPLVDEPGQPGLPSGFEVPIDVAGLTAAVERRFTTALNREREAIASDVGKLRDYFGARVRGAVGRGS